MSGNLRKPQRPHMYINKDRGEYEVMNLIFI